MSSLLTLNKTKILISCFNIGFEDIFTSWFVVYSLQSFCSCIYMPTNQRRSSHLVNLRVLQLYFDKFCHWCLPCKPPRIIHIEKLVKIWKLVDFWQNFGNCSLQKKIWLNKKKKWTQAICIYMIFYFSFQNWL